jgi:allene oxide cyclase
MRSHLYLGVALASVVTLITPAVAGDSVSVVERVASEMTVDLGAKGDSLGDLLVFANPLYDADNRAQVGADQGYCVRVIVAKAWECTWTVLLKDGQITAQGPIVDKADSVMAITGGTGKYAGAKGTLMVHPRNAESYDFKYQLL